ncbi:MAG TPA: L-seryl-tRNA(Sec) selenium transferase, partial [Rhodocyclaceae bacterium]|nr:L-seryl-tRNA(Sec) selenium transferase [Rhodocyclaceae bacterium]
MNDLARLPSVDRLLVHPAVAFLIESLGRAVVTKLVRDTLADVRNEVRAGAPLPDEAALLAKVSRGGTPLLQPKLRAVFNLTGTVLHTNLGRALMPREAAQAVAGAMTHPVNLEFDLDGGERGER